MNLAHDEKVTELWNGLEKHIAYLRNQTLRLERLYYDLLNFSPPSVTFELVAEGTGVIRVSNWPRDLSTALLLTCLKKRPSYITETNDNYMFTADGILVNVRYADEGKNAPPNK